MTLSSTGTHSIVAQDTDAVGNTGASTPVTFTLAALPTVTIAPVDGNNVINAGALYAGVPASEIPLFGLTIYGGPGQNTITNAPTRDLIAIKYLETLEKMAEGPATKILLPLATAS